MIKSLIHSYSIFLQRVKCEVEVFWLGSCSWWHSTRQCIRTVADFYLCKQYTIYKQTSLFVAIRGWYLFDLLWAITHFSESIIKINADLYLLSDWVQNSKMQFNIKKSSVMWFSTKSCNAVVQPQVLIDETPLSQANKQKYLGVVRIWQ